MKQMLRKLICAVLTMALVIAMAPGAMAYGGYPDLNNVKIESGVLSWDAYPGTGNYWIGVDGMSLPTTETTYALNERIDNMIANLEIEKKESYTITIQAYNSEGSDVLAQSELTYSYNSPVAAIVPGTIANAKIEAGILKWDEYEGASEWIIEIDNTSFPVFEMTFQLNEKIDELITSGDLTKKSSYAVAIIARNGNHVKIAEWKTTYEYESEAVTPAPEPGPSDAPSEEPSESPSTDPATQPSDAPSTEPGTQPTDAPSTDPGTQPTDAPSTEPGTQPTDAPSTDPGTQPTDDPTVTPIVVATVGALKYQLSGTSATVTGPKSQNIKTAKIPATITVEGETYKVTAIKASAFKGLKKLATVSIGKNVKTIGKSAFNGCAKLKTVSGMAGVTKIGASAFQGCKALAKITLPAKVKTIGAKAFYKCAKLKSVVIQTTKLTEKTVGANAFKGVYRKATVKVPAKKLKAYKTLLVKKGLPKTAKVKK